MSRNVLNAAELHLPKLPRKHSRRLAAGKTKLNMTVCVPSTVGIALRQVALNSGRSASDLASEAIQYWLDSNYPDWDLSI